MNGLMQRMSDFLITHIGMNGHLAAILTDVAATAVILLIGIGSNWIIQSAFRWIASHNTRLAGTKWHQYLVQRKIGHNILLIIPGLIAYILPYLFYENGDKMIRILHRADIVYMLIVMMMTANSALLIFLDAYSKTEKSRSHPMQGVIQGLQVILYFIGGIIIVAVIIDKSPAVLLTGLGASAAVLMLVFKDSILGFVAGVQLSRNDMIKIGDWIQLPDGSANGNVEEITLNTVKVRNWDNSISMVPPYTLVSTIFRNWRGMQESGGRRVDKCIYIDMNSLEIYSSDMIADLCKAVPLMKELFEKDPKNEPLTNLQLYRMYTEGYLRRNEEVNQNLDLIITQKEVTAYGLPIEIYFFLKDKRWAYFEKKQSDIFDHLMTMTSEFGLRLYQRP